MESDRAEVALIGAGPIGIELAVALKKRGIDYLHFDAKQIGYTISWFAPQTRFFSSNERIAIAGVPLSYRRERLPEKSIKYWLLPEINNLIETGRIKAYFGTQPTVITPTHVTLGWQDRVSGFGSRVSGQTQDTPSSSSSEPRTPNP